MAIKDEVLGLTLRDCLFTLNSGRTTTVTETI